MKMDVEQKIVGEMPMHLIENLLNSIEESDWYGDDYRGHLDTMSSCNSIPLRHTPLCYSGLETKEPIQKIENRKLYAKFEKHIVPILDELRKHYTFNEYACFIARLAPKSTIGAHVDKGTFLSMCHRIHVPLKSNPQVRYNVGTKTFYWEPGKIYEFDNMRLHSASNRSDEERIHLVINLYNLPEDF
jgi:hypothetical protein